MLKGLLVVILNQNGGNISLFNCFLFLSFYRYNCMNFRLVVRMVSFFLPHTLHENFFYGLIL